MLFENRKSPVMGSALYQSHCKFRSCHCHHILSSLFDAHAYLSCSQQLGKPQSNSIAASCSKFCEYSGLHHSLPLCTFLKRQAASSFAFQYLFQKANLLHGPELALCFCPCQVSKSITQAHVHALRQAFRGRLGEQVTTASSQVAHIHTPAQQIVHDTVGEQVTGLLS